MRIFKDALRTIYRRMNRLSGGSLGIVKDTLERLGKARASQAAAAMAYYALFSLFPLLLALVAAWSFVLEREQAFQQVVGFVTEAIPISQALIERNVQRVLELRGTVGVVGLLGLLWSGMGAFDVLANNINRAWTDAEPRNFLERRLVALGMVGALGILLALSLVSTTVLNLLPQLQVHLWDSVPIYETPLWGALSNFVPWLFTFLMFLALYLWVPNTKVERRAALWGALVAALAWEVAANGLAWYLRSGLVQYELVYGSLGAVVALMFWIYWSSWIALFGAHLSAAIAQHASEVETA
jgi:membrane protein